MPKNKFQDVVFTAIMATIMVYGMVVYNVALNTGGVTGQTFLMAVHELPIMVPIAFVLEFFVVGKIARMLAFTVMTPNDRPQFITYAISICICCIMCPLMSLVATILFKDTKTFGTWVQTWGMNFPMAICYQMFYCGPLVRLIFRTVFQRKENCLTKDLPVIQKYNSQYATKQINQRFCAADFDCFPACFRKQAAKCDPAAKTNGGSQCIHRQVINVCYP